MGGAAGPGAGRGPAELSCGQATTTGEVPWVEPWEAVDAALDCSATFPVVPVLDAPHASLLAQAVSGIEGVTVDHDGQLSLAGSPTKPADLVAPDLSDSAHEALRMFLAAASAERPEAVRVGLLGPVSLARALCDAGLDRRVAIPFAARAVALHAAALLDATCSSIPDTTVLVCASEPGLVGSVHPTFPFGPAQLLELLQPFVTALDEGAWADLVIGVHVPGTADWSSIIASGVSLISLPVDQAVRGWSDVMEEFLRRGGRIVWGAVPVDEPLGTTEALLWRRLERVWDELESVGVDPQLLRSRSLVAPVDGLAHFDPAQVAGVTALVESLATRVRSAAQHGWVSVGA